MSPRPVELNAEYFQGQQDPNFSEMVARVKRLIETPVYYHDHPQDAVIDKTTDLELSSAILFRGRSLYDFAYQAITQNLLPYNPNNPHNPVFLHKGFGVDASFNKKTEVLTVTRAGKSELSVQINAREFTHPYHWAVMEAVAGLAVIHDGYWEEIRDNGVVVGRLDGDYYDKTWHIQTDKGAILLPDINDPTPNPPLDTYNSVEVGGNIQSQTPDGKRLMRYHPVAILADLRTGI